MPHRNSTLITDDAGATKVEYAYMVAFVAIVAIAIVTVFGQHLLSMMTMAADAVSAI